MKVVNVLTIIFYLVSVVLIPISWFELEGKVIITAIGYGSLILGGLMVLLKVYLTFKQKKSKHDRDNNKTN